MATGSRGRSGGVSRTGGGGGLWADRRGGGGGHRLAGSTAGQATGEVRKGGVEGDGWLVGGGAAARSPPAVGGGGGARRRVGRRWQGTHRRFAPAAVVGGGGVAPLSLDSRHATTTRGGRRVPGKTTRGLAERRKGGDRDDKVGPTKPATGWVWTNPLLFIPKSK
jgi:hypothetical protein